MKKEKNIFLPLLLLIIAIYLIYTFLMMLTPIDMATRGQIGDMFGGINALFSGGALAGVVYAIFLQKKDLDLQKKELKLTREELKRTAEAQEKSQEALSKQVESMEKTAELNGLSSILAYLGSSLITSMTGHTDINLRDQIKREGEEIRQEIEKRIGIKKKQK